MRHASLRAAALATLLASCSGNESPPARASTASTASTASAAAVSTAREDALERAAADVVSFLAGGASFDALALGDTVELFLVPEGAGTLTGTSVRLASTELRDRAAWKIDAGRRRVSFVPPRRLTKVTTRAGTHFDCREVPLVSRAPRLAARPHVGVLLQSPDAQSCLETWNATFVFDTSGTRPRLVAAVYDQWEW